MTKKNQPFSTHLNVHGGVLISAGSSVADLVVAAAGSISPGKVSGLTDQLSTGLPSAPQFRAGLHVWAGFGARTKG